MRILPNHRSLAYFMSLTTLKSATPIGRQRMDSKLKVMIVDDDEMTQVLISNILDSQYQTIAVNSGPDCLAQLPEINPDIILLDVNMPGMDGLDVCRQIRSQERHKHSVIMFVSASDSKDEIIAGYDAGADDYLLKPLHHDTLLAKMAHCASLIRQRREVALLHSGSETADNRFTQPYSRFVQELKSCQTPTAVAEKLFSFTRRANLCCRLQISQDQHYSYFSDDGLLQPIESHLLEQVRSLGLVYRFGKRVVINFEKVSLLVRNMPEADDDYSQQLQDFLVHLVGTADVYLHLLANRLQNIEMRDTLHSAAEALQFIHQEFSEHSTKVNEVLDSVALDFSRNLDQLQLTDEQEDFMVNLIDDRMRKLVDLNQQAMHIEGNMQDFIENLSRKQSTG